MPKLMDKETIWTAAAGRCEVLEALDTNAPLGKLAPEALEARRRRLADRILAATRAFRLTTSKRLLR